MPIKNTFSALSDRGFAAFDTSSKFVVNWSAILGPNYGPFGDLFQRIAVSDNGQYFAITANGGGELRFSSDYGQTITTKLTGLNSNNLDGDIVMSSDGKDIIFGTSAISSNAGDVGFAVSRDFGSTWSYRFRNSGLLFNAYGMVEFPYSAFNYGRFALARTLSEPITWKLYRSEDYGLNWVEKKTWPDGPSSPRFSDANGNGHRGGTIAFGNNGNTGVMSGNSRPFIISYPMSHDPLYFSVQQITTLPDVGSSSYQAVAISKFNTVIAAGVFTSSSEKRGLYISKDLGVTWTKHFSGLHSWTRISISNDGSVILAETLGRLYMSHDTGSSWEQVNFYNPNSVSYMGTVSGDGQIKYAIPYIYATYHNSYLYKGTF